MTRNAFVENVKNKLKPRSKKQSFKKVKPTIAKQSLENEATIAKQSPEKEEKPTIAKLSLENKGKPPIAKQSLEKDVKPTSQNPEKEASKKKEFQNKAIPGTVYVGHIPHGFYEQELRKFFSQFGKITYMRLCRSCKTGGSKGYAFIQFQFEEVAKVVAESMNNYLFFKKILKCHFIPPNEVHPKLFKGYKKGSPLRCDINRMKHNMKRTAEERNKIADRRVNRLRKLKAKLIDQGITAFKVKSFAKKREEIREKL